MSSVAGAGAEAAASSSEPPVVISAIAGANTSARIDRSSIVPVVANNQQKNRCVGQTGAPFFETCLPSALKADSIAPLVKSLDTSLTTCVVIAACDQTSG